MSDRRAAVSGRPKRTILKILSTVLTAVLVLVIGLYGVMWVLAKGPSPTASRTFVMSVKETSAVGFLANLYFSQEEIDEIMGSGAAEPPAAELDTSLITVSPPKPVYLDSDSGEDENSNKKDGIEIVEVTGIGYHGLMMIVDDPSRLIVGVPDSFGGAGLTLMQMMEKYGTIAGINAGGFYDPNGNGGGGIPDGMVICDGEILWGDEGVSVSTIGFDADYVLHVGNMTLADAREAKLQWAVSFGPALVVNGSPVSAEALQSGVNPRTAIGQRADGAVLLLVIDGRQIDTLGATYGDLADIFLEFGAVNASNLDGGSSSLMMYEGEIINTCASVIGIRPIPTSFLVK